MAIALLTLADLLTPLQAIAGRWMAPRRSRRANNLRYVAIRPSYGEVRSTDSASASGTASKRPLRVVRVVGDKPTNCAGRVVISGRIGDVCAELDRLAALEARDLARTLSTTH